MVNIVGFRRTVQICAERKSARFILLTRSSQRDIITEVETVGTYGTRGCVKK